jgi:hypothetical protein
MKTWWEDGPGCDISASHGIQATWNLLEPPSESISLVTGGVVLLGNTYGEDSFGGQELVIGVTSFTKHYPLEPSSLNTHTHTYLQQSLVLCVACALPCFFQRLQFFSKRICLETLIVASVPGCLFPFLPLLEAFLRDCALDVSCIHTCSIALRDTRSEHMSTGVIPFL